MRNVLWTQGWGYCWPIFCIRIQKLLRAHLEESGWVDDLKDLAKGEKGDGEKAKIGSWSDIPCKSSCYFFNNTFVSKSFSITWCHDHTSMRHTLSHIAYKPKRNFFQYTHVPAGPRRGLRCVQAEKARAQDVPNLENLVKQISESAAGELIPLPSPPFFVSSYSTSPCTFHCRSTVIKSFVHHWLMTCHLTQVW